MRPPVARGAADTDGVKIRDDRAEAALRGDDTRCCDSANRR